VETVDILSLFGRAVAINRFLSWSTNRCKPFFKAIKRAQRDKWDEKCERDFQELKKYLTSPFLLSKLEAVEDLYIYLAGSEVTLSSAVIREELRAQLLVFYTSKAIIDAKNRYPKIKKLILALVVVARKLISYFQAHTIIVMTQYPLRLILQGPNASQRVIKWAHFIVEFTPSLGDAIEMPNDSPKAADHTLAVPTPLDGDFWHLHVDETSNYKGSGTKRGPGHLKQAITLCFKASN